MEGLFFVVVIGLGVGVIGLAVYGMTGRKRE